MKSRNILRLDPFLTCAGGRAGAGIGGVKEMVGTRGPIFRGLVGGGGVGGGGEDKSGGYI